MGDGVSNIFNIRWSCPFWDTLAQIYLDKYKNDNLALAGVLFLVPNRRACQALTAAFIRKQGLKPTILPQIVPIAEIDGDDLFFSGFNLPASFFEQKQTISKEERLFLFARLIMSKPNDFGLRQISLAQAVSLAIDLADLIDTAYNQGLDFNRLSDLVPEKYAAHWQETLRLLKIITEFWPQILEERGAIDAAELKRLMLLHQAEIWEEEKTSRNIVAAGITANFPAIVRMLKCIQGLPNGEIYFAGIDRFADNCYWEAVDETHPQFELKSLLELLEINRADVRDVFEPNNIERERLISEFMRPAGVSDKWRNIASDIDIAKAASGVSLISCKTQRDEALAIAMKMRDVLTHKEKTAALITYDRNLARRVAAELQRFDISVDDSAGLPLNLSPAGIFLRLIAEAAEDMESETKFVSLLKSPFTLMGKDAADIRQEAYGYETALRQKKETGGFEIAKAIKLELQELTDAISSPKIEFSQILELHIRLAEKLASSDTSGKNLLWRGDAGKALAQFISRVMEQAPALGEISGKDYLALLCVLMGLECVRSNYGTHPRLSILGPIEARLHHFDYVILGEFNEGVWPKPAQADMWMSRPMKKDFGFSLPEKNIGILGADLCGFFAAPNVIMTRADRIDGTPTKKSRWLLRLETVLQALGTDIEALDARDFSLWVNKVDSPASFSPIKAPAPCPPLYARPRKLSASAVDLLISDPYSVYAKYILKLYPFNDLDMPADQRDYGTLIHAVIEKFNNLYPARLPYNAYDVLVELGKGLFAENKIAKELEAFWFPRFLKTAAWLIEQEKDYREGVLRVNNEISGEMTYNMPGGDFTFTAKADRIDVLTNGEVNIIDYKTGAIPSKKQVLSGHALQLLLEGLIASRGGYSILKSNKVNELIYWRLGDCARSFNTKDNEEDILGKCQDYLLRLISAFDFETTPYHARPVPKFIPKNRDYEHLERIKEWSVLEEGESNDD